MIKTINAYSLDEAREIFYEENSINLQEIFLEKLNKTYSFYEGLGLLFVVCTTKPDTNNNKIHTTLEDIIITGEKSWETKYIIINCYNKKINNKTYKIKKEAIDDAREYTSNNFIDTKVIIGKSLLNNIRNQAIIKYKPSLKQEAGIYKFIY